jgi:hypothetical protein
MKTQVRLGNTVYRGTRTEEKVYIDSVRLAVARLPFAMRQVFLRFADGPGLDFTTADMDRIVIEYLKLRGVKLPPQILALAEVPLPQAGDFLVPRSLVPTSLGQSLTEPPRRPRTSRKPPNGPKRPKKRACERCRRRVEISADWYDGLCPSCADKTEGEWVCARCDSRGSFEQMGGSGVSDPTCCGFPCDHAPPS